MEQTFGDRLQVARKQAGFKTQESLGAALRMSGKTIRNYEGNRTRPDPATLESLRELLGDFDADGDPVEVAVKQSGLTKFRQTKVIGFYQEQVYEQGKAERSSG